MMMVDLKPQRRISDQRWWVQALRFPLAPFVETWRGLSLVRLLATGFGGATVYIMLVTENISGGEIGMAVLSLAAAFGKKVFVPLATALVQRLTVVRADIRQHFRREAEPNARTDDERGR